MCSSDLKEKIKKLKSNVHVLSVSATPIPRSLALLLYGDLDLSVIDELPPGRKPILTYAVGPSYEDRIRTFIAKQIDEGRQAYIVCPLVEDSEEIEAIVKKHNAPENKSENESDNVAESVALLPVETSSGDHEILNVFFIESLYSL